MNVRDYGHWAIHVGDCRDALATMAGGSAQCCVTSPPYFGLRDYGHEGQIGLEETPAQYVAALVETFRLVRRALRDDAVLWLNLGDSYGPTKQLIGIPWRVAFALQEDGWYLRQDVIWHKPNPMPESVGDRCTKAHEYLFLLAKSERYYWNADAMQEPATGRVAGNKTPDRAILADPEKHRTRGGLLAYANKTARRKRGSVPGKPDPTGLETAERGESRNRRSVWTVATRPFKDAHFATYPEQLIEPCVAASSRPGDLVIDPFGGAGTTGLVALKQGRRAALCELNPQYADIAERRIATALYGEGFFG